MLQVSTGELVSTVCCLADECGHQELHIPRCSDDLADRRQGVLTMDRGNNHPPIWLCKKISFSVWNNEGGTTFGRKWKTSLLFDWSISRWWIWWSEPQSFHSAVINTYDEFILDLSNFNLGLLNSISIHNNLYGNLISSLHFFGYFQLISSRIFYAIFENLLTKLYDETTEVFQKEAVQLDLHLPCVKGL